MRLSRYSNFPDLDLFGIFELCFFNHVFFHMVFKSRVQICAKISKIIKNPNSGIASYAY